MERYLWLLFVAIAGLAWGTYVPVIFYGGSELTTKPGEIGGRLMAILCVGVAYFVLAVVIPLGLFVSGQANWPDMKTTGLVFASLAGIAGAVGAICVIFASKAAVDAAKETPEFKVQAAEVQRLTKEIEANPDRKAELEPERDEARGEMNSVMARYRIYIAPLIFGLAPLINTLVSIVWHPKPGHPFHFGFDVPDWKLLVGIVLVGTGTFLVLFSKEQGEAAKAKPAPAGPPASAHAPPSAPPSSGEPRP